MQMRNRYITVRSESFLVAVQRVAVATLFGRYARKKCSISEKLYCVANPLASVLSGGAYGRGSARTIAGIIYTITI